MLATDIANSHRVDKIGLTTKFSISIWRIDDFSAEKKKKEKSREMKNGGFSVS